MKEQVMVNGKWFEIQDMSLESVVVELSDGRPLVVNKKDVQAYRMVRE
jgi:hypothetical protein